MKLETNKLLKEFMDARQQQWVSNLSLRKILYACIEGRISLFWNYQTLLGLGKVVKNTCSGRLIAY